MLSVYWAAFGLGGIFLILTTFVGADHDSDGDTGDYDASGDSLHADMDHAHVDHGDVTHPGILDVLFLVFSVRFWSFFTGFFGLTGVGMYYIHGPGIVTLLTAIGMGFVAGFSISYLFKVMSRSNVSSDITTSDILGRRGKIVVPVAPDDDGKIRLVIKGQIIDRIAICKEGVFNIGDEATVVKVEDHIVHIEKPAQEVTP